MATARNVRAPVVAQAPPTAPSAGRPQVPGTSTRSKARFTAIAADMAQAAGPGLAPRERAPGPRRGPWAQALGTFKEARIWGQAGQGRKARPKLPPTKWPQGHIR